MAIVDDLADDLNDRAFDLGSGVLPGLSLTFLGVKFLGIKQTPIPQDRGLKGFLATLGLWHQGGDGDQAKATFGK